MGLLDKIFNEFIDIIEWVDNTKDTIVWKFPRYQNEIKMGAKLTVRESQVAIFINEGKIADVFQPGMYTLNTQNMPILSTLRGWKYGFDSPFKADVYFISTRQFTDQKWGTKNPVMLRDAEFGPVRLRAFGTYAFRVQDAALFLKEIGSSNPGFSVDDINAQLTNIAVARGMDAIAEQKIPILDLAANYDEVSKIITDKIKPEIATMGLEITTFLIENISLPQEVEQALDKRSSMGIVGDLGSYARFQAANAMEKSAENPNGGGLGAAGMGLGMGAAMMSQMGNMFQQPQNTQAGTPPPVPGAARYYVALDGKQHGPFNMEKLQEMVYNNSLAKDTMVWKQGMDNWAAASSVSELAQLFTNTPPPIPGT